MTDSDVDRRQIFWKPARHNSKTERLLDETRSKLKSKIDRLIDEVDSKAVEQNNSGKNSRESHASENASAGPDKTKDEREVEERSLDNSPLGDKIVTDLKSDVAREDDHALSSVGDRDSLLD